MRYLIFIFLGFIFLACSREQERIPALPRASEPEHKMVIYQIMTRLFGNKNTTNTPYGTRSENGVGKFNDITEKALSGIRELGVTHVWYTGIIEHATQSDYSAFGIANDDPDIVKGLAGSPYAIKDYYDVDPDLAVEVPDRMKEFEQLVNRTHAQQLKVIIDFVPNHVARAYHSDTKPNGIEDLGVKDDTTVSFHRNNNFYYLPGEEFKVPTGSTTRNRGSDRDGKFTERPAKVTGNDVFTSSPSVTDWYETVKLNYGVDIQDERKQYFNPIPSTRGLK